MKALVAIAVVGLLAVGIAIAAGNAQPMMAAVPPIASAVAPEPEPTGVAVPEVDNVPAPMPVVENAPPSSAVAAPEVVVVETEVAPMAPTPAVVGDPADTTTAPDLTPPWRKAANAVIADGGAKLEDLGPSPAPALDPRPFAEAHWQGLEAIPKTPTIAAALKLPPDLQGVILDDVTLPADLQGFRAGDVVTAIDGVATPTLVAFINATDRIREQKRIMVDIVRAGVPMRLELVALLKRLGVANGETPPMIPPGARRPHPYMGPCVNCHRIGLTGNLANDQGDTMMKNMPGPVRLTDPVKHRDRGPCAACHPILPP
jgi:hypothetical protein